jgi:transposase
MARREELTDEQWAIIALLIPEPPRRELCVGKQNLILHLRRITKWVLA